MRTIPLNRYTLLADCQNPQERFTAAGGVLVPGVSNITKGSYCEPMYVVAVGKGCQPEIEVGAIVYVVPPMKIQTYIEGGSYMSVHEDHILHVLPRSEVEGLGIKPQNCKSAVVPTPSSGKILHLAGNGASQAAALALASQAAALALAQRAARGR